MITIKADSLWKNRKTGKVVRVVEHIKDGLLRIEYNKGLVHRIPDRILIKKFDPLDNGNRVHVESKPCMENECTHPAVKDGWCEYHWFIQNEHKFNVVPEIKEGDINIFNYIGSVLKKESIPNGFTPDEFVNSYFEKEKKHFHNKSIADTGLYLMAEVIHDLRAYQTPTYNDFLNTVRKRSSEKGMKYDKNPRMLLKLGKLPWDFPFDVPVTIKRQSHVKKKIVKKKYIRGITLKTSQIVKRRKKLLSELEKLNRYEQMQKSQLQSISNQLIKLVMDLGFSKGWISKPTMGLTVRVKPEGSTL